MSIKNARTTIFAPQLNIRTRMTHDFDLITIGAGSGGVAASRRAAALGARVAIVEAGRVGGTCVLRGCVPKKLMMYAAGYRDAFTEAAGYGWAFGETHFDMGRWAAAKAAETERLEHIYRQLLLGSKVELIEGRAVIDGANRVSHRRTHDQRTEPAHRHRRPPGTRQHRRHRRMRDQRRTARPAVAAQPRGGGRQRLHRGRVRQHPGRGWA